MDTISDRFEDSDTEKALKWVEIVTSLAMLIAAAVLKESSLVW